MSQRVYDSETAMSEHHNLHDMIRVKNAHLEYLFETPLYYEASKGIGFEVYKPSFVTINDLRIKNDRIPSGLYVHTKDKPTWLRELQKGLNTQLKIDLKSNNPSMVKNTLVSLADEMISDPGAGIEGAMNTLDIIFHEYLKNRDVIDKLVNVMSKDYTTAVHSVNVMSLTLRFCLFCHFEEEESKKLGLAALLHDVGKVKVNNRILKSSRKLTDAEFEIMKKHTVFGHEILRSCNLSDEICLCALHHHERADGSGYPNGMMDVSHEAEIIGFIDCYEALTCNERPYRNATTPFKALSHIKTELFGGKFKSKVFEKFVKSLGRYRLDDAG
jgi:putative nucleotidyltransferase with HDIG domain